jgi:hypothetical protein
MQHVILFATALLLGGAGSALAQAPENSLPEGTFASSPEDCTTLKSKTAAELGEDLDFEVLTKKGLVAYQQACDFVNVLAHDAKSWVATAFCDEAGYSYPDLFSIKQKVDGKLNVTRITDLTQQGGYDTSAQSDTGVDAPEKSVRGTKPGAGEPSSEESKSPDEQGASESYSTFFKCESVKP